MSLHIFTIVGARPQFVKAAVVSRAIAEYNRGDRGSAEPIEEFLLHTGQHFDRNMSDVFFQEMGIPKPDCHLGICMQRHAAMTGRMMEAIEDVLLQRTPDVVLLYGDTNSTLAGALAAAKLHIRVAHVEAGLRSFNRRMPEEVNRILTAHAADLHFCPTDTAVQNLKREGITTGVHLVGDVMYDAALQYGDRARRTSTILEALDLAPKAYCLATVHRPDNTDFPETLQGILSALEQIPFPIVFPVHPRTRNTMSRHGMFSSRRPVGNLRFIDPVGYLDMVRLEQEARLIFTDSGGIQKEACFHGVPCITLRRETEWTETVQAGWNRLAGSEPSDILDAFRQSCEGGPVDAYGDGRAGARIVEVLCQ